MTEQHRSATMRVLRVAFLSSTALDLVGTLAVGLIAVEAGLRVANGSLPLGPALLVILLAPEAYRPLREMAARYHASTDAAAVISDIDEILTPTPHPSRTPELQSAPVDSTAARPTTTPQPGRTAELLSARDDSAVVRLVGDVGVRTDAMRVRYPESRVDALQL